MTTNADIPTEDSATTPTGEGLGATSCSPPLTASEAVFGLLGWLTSRDEKVTLSRHHDAAPAAEIAKQFCDENSLSEPREGWQHNLIHPSGQCSHSAENANVIPPNEKP